MRLASSGNDYGKCLGVPAVAQGQRVFLDQTWDLVAPVNTHTFNLVGNLFSPGNTGLMRQQLAWIGRFGAVEVAAATGMQGANGGATFNNVERSATPSVAARLGYHLAPGSWFGVSAIASSLRLTSGTEQEKRMGEADIGRLVGDPSTVRNRAKIAATIKNAQAFLQVQERHGSFAAWQWGFVDGQPQVNHWNALSELPAKTPLSDKMAAECKRLGFSFLGSTVLYAHLQATGAVNDHLVSCFRHRELSGPPSPT